MSGKRYAIRYRDDDDWRVTKWMPLNYDFDKTLRHFNEHFYNDDTAEIICWDFGSKIESVERPENNHKTNHPQQHEAGWGL